MTIPWRISRSSSAPWNPPSISPNAKGSSIASQNRTTAGKSEPKNHIADRRSPVTDWNRTLTDDRGPEREAERIAAVRAPLRGDNSKAELDRRLDHALAETFPASDPVAILVD